MRLIFLLVFILGISIGIYVFITYFVIHFKELRKINWPAFAVSIFVGLSLMLLIGVAIFQASKRSDSWCTTKHYTNAYPPQKLISSMDYFEKANYEYDRGNCDEALTDYSKSIELNGDYPQAFNNRAYTYMRMEEFDLALADLNMAIEIDPNYLHALRNRADLNTYRKNNKALGIIDYNKIIDLVGPTTDVCAHLADAKNSSKNPLSFITTLINTINCTQGKN